MTNKEWETSPITPDTQSRGSRKVPGRQSVVFLVRSDVKKELERGKRKFESGDTDGARLAYERALDLDPGCAIAYFYLGFTYHEMGNLESAKEYYLQAIDLERKQSLFLEHLARLHFETEEYSVCLVRFQEAQAVGPLQPISYGLMGRAHFELDRYPESISCLEKMLEIEEEPRLRRIAMYYLILAHLKDGSLIPARRRAHELLEDEHADPLILSALADRFQAAGCLSLALAFLERMEEDSEGVADRVEEIQTLLSRTEPRLHNLFTSDEEKLLHHLHFVSQVGGDRIYRVLMSLMETPSALVREAVVSYCRKFGYEVGEPTLEACLSGEPLLREAALLYLAETFESRYLELLSPNLSHPSTEIQLAVARYLERRGRFEHLRLLEARMEVAEGAGPRRQIQRAINQIKRRHTEQTDKMIHKEAQPMRALVAKQEEKRLGILRWVALGLLLVYVSIRSFLFFFE